MPRVKAGFTRRRRHKKVLKATKGFWGSRGKLYRIAHEAFIRSGEHAFRGRKLRKRQLRRLWIVRINAGLQNMDLKYNQFINKLNKSKIQLNRKSLSEIAFNDFDAFKQVVKKVLK